MADHPERQSAIDAHGIIGDMRSAALVNDKGSVDFFLLAGIRQSIDFLFTAGRPRSRRLPACS